jgi:hypothetical protein
LLVLLMLLVLMLLVLVLVLVLLLLMLMLLLAEPLFLLRNRKLRVHQSALTDSKTAT